MIYQHYPSEKWGYSYDLDLTAATKVRDLNINKLKILGGTEQGLVMHINDSERRFNILTSGILTPVTVAGNFPSTITLPAGGGGGFDPLAVVGLWGVLYCANMSGIYYCRILSLIGDTFTLDLIVNSDNPNVLSAIPFVNPFGTPALNAFCVGGIPQIIDKTFDFSTPTELKKIQNLYIKGSNLSELLTKVFGFDSRLPSTLTDDATNISGGEIWRVDKISIAKDTKVSTELFLTGAFTTIKGLGLKMV